MTRILLRLLKCVILFGLVSLVLLHFAPEILNITRKQILHSETLQSVVKHNLKYLKSRGESESSDLAFPYQTKINNKPIRINYNTHIFYYAWYGAPNTDGQWIHWNHRYLENWDTNDKRVFPKGQHRPPDDIGANFFPQLGAYSSRNVSVIEQHFEWVREANVGVVAVSWYPPGLSDENGPQSDSMVPLLLDTALKFNLSICLHIEPYQGRSAPSLRKYLAYVHKKYASHPAYYKMSVGRRKLPLFYLYDSYQVAPEEWRRLFSRKGDLTVRNTELDAVFIALLVELKHRADIKVGKFDGYYTYFAANGFTYGSTWKNWKSLADYAIKNSLMFIPSVGPGYVDTRVRPWNARNARERRNGLYYETSWRTALATSARQVSITSFNEWHEGTQIEPAVPKTDGRFTYINYTPKSPNFYLEMTRNFSLHPNIYRDW